MKKLVFALLIVAVAIGIYVYMKGPERIDNSPKTNTPSSTFRPDPSSATFTFDDGPITLSQGRAEKSVSSSGMLIEEIVLTEKIAYGDINNDGKEDAAVLVLRSGGGSGSFIYLAALVSTSATYKGTNTLFIGDRIMANSISISESGRIKVEYLDRKEDEPMAAQPSVSVSKEFIYRSGNLQEI